MNCIGGSRVIHDLFSCGLSVPRTSVSRGCAFALRCVTNVGYAILTSQDDEHHCQDKRNLSVKHTTVVLAAKPSFRFFMQSSDDLVLPGPAVKKWKTQSAQAFAIQSVPSALLFIPWEMTVESFRGIGKSVSITRVMAPMIVWSGINACRSRPFPCLLDHTMLMAA